MQTGKENTTKYFIAALVFAILTFLTVGFSLLPWMKERHRHAAERYRVGAYRLAMMGAYDQSESFYRAALAEAHELSDPELLRDIESESAAFTLIKSQLTEKLQFNKEAGQDQSWLWPSLMQYIEKAKHNRRQTKLWMPIFRIVFEREQMLSRNPARLLQLGDFQMELFNLESAESLYRQAGVEADESGSDGVKVQVLNRLAQLAYSREDFDEAMRCLNSASKLLAPNDDTVKAILTAHKAQVYADCFRPEEGEAACSAALKLPAVERESKLKWYILIIRGQCLSIAGRHEEALQILSACRKTAESFEIQDQSRCIRAMAEALVEANRGQVADSYFFQLADLRNPSKKYESIDYERQFMSEAQIYRGLKKHKQDLYLCDLALRTREARVGTVHRGLVNVLTVEKEGLIAAGDPEKARAAQARIDMLIRKFGPPPNRQDR